MAMIDNEELLIDSEHEKKLLRALKRIHKACNEIREMGYTIFVAEHGSFNAINKTDEEAGVFIDLDIRTEHVVASTQIQGMDCGAW